MRGLRTGLAMAAAAAIALMAAAGPATAGARTSRPDIVQTAAAAGTFTTLTSLLQRAGLVGTLKDTGPYTVFAPTDKAFAKVPRDTLRTLAGDRTKLRSVLLHHVARGRLTAARVVKRSSIRMLDGTRVAVRTRGGAVSVGGARVTDADIGASNGVVHVIGRVLIPR